MEKEGIRIQAIDRRTKAPGMIKSLLSKMGLKVQELSFEDIRGLLQQEVDKLDMPGSMVPAKLHFVREVFDDSFVYLARQEGEPDKLFKQNYSVDAEMSSTK